MTRVRHAHLSLKWSAPPSAVHDYVARVARDADLITTTETQSEAMESAIRKALPGWRVVRRGEFVIAGRRGKVRVTRFGRLVRLSHVYSGSSAWRDVRVHKRRVRVGRARLLVAVSHLPSGVQDGPRWKRNGQSEAHRRGARAWGESLRRSRFRFEGKSQRLWRVAAMDCNLDQHLTEWRAYMQGQLRMPGMWNADRPRGGTHAGGRLIDTIHTDAPIRSAHIVSVDPGVASDHRGVLAVYEVTGKRRR